MNKKEKLEDLDNKNIEFINSRLTIRKKKEQRRELKQGIFAGIFITAFATILQLCFPINPTCLAVIGLSLIGTIGATIAYKKTPSEHSELDKLVGMCPEYKEKFEELKAQMGKEYTAEEGLNNLGDWIRADMEKLEVEIKKEEASKAKDNHVQLINDGEQTVYNEMRKVKLDKESVSDIEKEC